MTDEGVGVFRRGDATVESLVPEDWRVAWDSSPALIVVTLGPSHRLAYQNRSAQAMFGVRPLGVRFTEAFPELGTVGVAPLDDVLETGAVVDVPARAVRCATSQRARCTCATCSRRWARRPSAW